MFKKIAGISVVCFWLASVFSGCGGYAPDLVITDAAVASSSSEFYDFSTHALLTTTTRTLLVTNTGDQAATLGTISDTGLGLGDPFYVTGGTCVTGATLAGRGGNCTLIVSFKPVDEVSFDQRIILNFSEKGKAMSPSFFGLKGVGTLDCSVSSDLASGRTQGVQAAVAKMTQDQAQGTADGRALTAAQGTADGKADGYNDGYQQGYNDTTFGYPAGYTLGFKVGYDQGAFNSDACLRGSSLGNSDGTFDGYRSGEFDGYHKGYSDGHVDGNTVGYQDGYSDGANSCPATPAAPGTPARSSALRTGVPKDPWLEVGARKNTLTVGQMVDACYKQGYSATYDSNTYARAYAAAKAANRPYQDAYALSYAQWKQQGIVDGESQGYADGKAKGVADGYPQGYNAEYTACYHNAYLNSWNLAYSSGYNDLSFGYHPGYVDGYNDGYNSGYSRGFSDGQFDFCGTNFAARSSTSRFAPALHAAFAPSRLSARSAPWLKQVSPGEFRNVFVDLKKPIPSLSKDQLAELESLKAEAKQDAADHRSKELHKVKMTPSYFEAVLWELKRGNSATRKKR